uniref:Ribosomal-protein-alanine N-acetyltransferase n=1 Tax=Ignisphaera aggregans TaxID=334771 RepID=A0A7C2VNT7_9CREN
MLVIRQAKIEDLDHIYELEVACFDDPYPKRLLYMLLSLYPELFLVVELDGQVVGYVSGLVRKDGYGHIASLCVHPNYRMRGIGTKLLKALEDVFKKQFGIYKYRLEVKTSNIKAINLYAKLGYKITDIIPNYYPDGEDAYVMIKDFPQES